MNMLTIPLIQADRQLAMQFAAEQATPQKGMRVYLNTLAVLAVQRYLGWLQIDADFDQGDSCNPGLRALFDIADLVLPDLGRLECRPVLPGEGAIALPPETTANRIGYVAVQFGDPAEATTEATTKATTEATTKATARTSQNANLNEVQLLGFFPAADRSTQDEPLTTLQLSDFQPLDLLLEYITHLETQLASTQVTAPTKADAADSPVATTTPSTPKPEESSPVNLQQWWHNIFEPGWQAIEALLGPQPTGFAFRTTATQRRARLIELNPTAPLDRLPDSTTTETTASARLALVVALNREGRNSSTRRQDISGTPQTLRTSIQLQLHPADRKTELPPQTRLILLDDTNTIFREIIARPHDALLQYEFFADPGEQFSVQVALNDDTVTERFTL